MELCSVFKPTWSRGSMMATCHWSCHLEFSICWHPMVLWHTVRHTMPVLRNRFPPRCRDIGAELFPRHPLWTSLEVLWHIFRATGSWRLLGSKLFIWSVLQQRLGRVEKLQTDFVFAFFSQMLPVFVNSTVNNVNSTVTGFDFELQYCCGAYAAKCAHFSFHCFPETRCEIENAGGSPSTCDNGRLLSPPRYTTIHEMSGDFHRGQKLRLRGAFAKSFGGSCRSASCEIMWLLPNSRAKLSALWNAFVNLKSWIPIAKQWNNYAIQS